MFLKLRSISVGSRLCDCCYSGSADGCNCSFADGRHGNIAGGCCIPEGGTLADTLNYSDLLCHTVSGCNRRDGNVAGLLNCMNGCGGNCGGCNNGRRLCHSRDCIGQGHCATAPYMRCNVRSKRLFPGMSMLRGCCSRRKRERQTRKTKTFSCYSVLCLSASDICFELLQR